MAGIKAMGTSLTLKKKAGETAVVSEDLVVAALTKIGEQKTEIEEVDVTTLDSPDGAKEFISGAKNPGAIDVEGNFPPSNKEQIESLYSVFKSGNNRDFKIEYTNGDTLEFSAYLSSFGYKEVSTDGLLGFSMSLKLSGLPVYTKKA